MKISRLIQILETLDPDSEVLEDCKGELRVLNEDDIWDGGDGPIDVDDEEVGKHIIFGAWG